MHIIPDSQGQIPGNSASPIFFETKTSVLVGIPLVHSWSGPREEVAEHMAKQMACQSRIFLGGGADICGVGVDFPNGRTSDKFELPTTKFPPPTFLNPHPGISFVCVSLQRKFVHSVILVLKYR